MFVTCYTCVGRCGSVMLHVAYVCMLHLAHVCYMLRMCYMLYT